jgi:ectoine hydroxylase-related dioxygenase (phytanoyl-CoA dioxygenase family)
MTDKALQATLQNIDKLGLKEHLLDVETQGFTVIPQALSDDQTARASAAILSRVNREQEITVDPNCATADDFNGMTYQHYLLFEDPIFPEILLEPKPLGLMDYLLGRSCVLSSMGSHFRGPGGMPLALHADGVSVGMTEASLVANCNYALTPYSQEAGALLVVPGSHRKNRQPTAHENWMVGDQTIADVMKQNLQPEEIDQLEWTAPKGAVTLNINPGDAVVWHGNTWHGGWRRDLPGTRINLAAYFCRPHMSTQERRGDDRHPQVFERFKNEPRFAQLLGENVFNGWREEGPDFSGAKTAPVGLYD